MRLRRAIRPVVQAILLLVVSDDIVAANGDPDLAEPVEDVPAIRLLDAAGDSPHASLGSNRDGQLPSRHPDELTATLLLAELVEYRYVLSCSKIADDRTPDDLNVARVERQLSASKRDLG